MINDFKIGSKRAFLHYGNNFRKAFLTAFLLKGVDKKLNNSSVFRCESGL